MGDLLTLIEQAEQAFDEEQTARAAAKMTTGELSLEDFLEQMLAIRKMGPIGNILGMLPGANAGQMKDALAQVDDRQMDKLQAIIRGMTPAERADPKIINGSRRLRIANGSGVTVNEVNELVNRFFEARKMMKQMAGQFGFGGGRSATRKQAKRAQGQEGQGGPRTHGPRRRRPGCPAGMPGMPDLSAAAAVAARAAAGARPAAPRLRPEPSSSSRRASRAVYRLRGVAAARRGSTVELCVDAAGRLTDEPIAGAETLVDGGWIVPGPGRRALPRRARPAGAGGPGGGRATRPAPTATPARC